MNTSERLAEGLVRAHEHWNAVHDHSSPHRSAPPAYTIAFSRQCGTYGAAIAREVGNRLGWAVYDSELLQHIANDMGIHHKLLASVDERQENWLADCLEGFLTVPHVSPTAFFHKLMKTMLTLASHGNCVIVGRGATKALPAETTLRVRVVAPLKHRIEAVEQELGLSQKDASARVAAVDRERDGFVESHFGIEPADPANYDLVLNAASFTAKEGADVVIAALEQMRRKAALAPVRPAAAPAEVHNHEARR